MSHSTAKTLGTLLRESQVQRGALKTDGQQEQTLQSEVFMWP